MSTHIHPRRVTLACCALSLLAAATQSPAQPAASGPTDSEDPAIKAQVINLIRQYYFRPVEIDTSLPVRTIVSRLDPHSSYDSKVAADRFNATINNEGFHGFGLWTMRIGGACYVDYAERYDYADLAGIRAGDKILEIGGHPISAMSDSALSAFLWDAGEWAFEVLLYRPSVQDTFRLWVTRNFSTDFPSIEFGMIDDTTGVVEIDRFAKGVADELRTALDRLTGRGMRSLIIDLRGNPGGYVNEMLDCERLFVGGSTILLSQRSKVDAENQTYKADRNAAYPTLPLIILVNHDSWSAAELFTGSLQDLDRATVIGEPTGGKALVMRRFTLSNGDELYLAVAGAILPSGRCPQALYDQGRYIMPQFDLARGDNTAHANDDYYSEMPCKTFTSSHGRRLSWHEGIIPDIIIPHLTEYLPDWYVKILDTIAVTRLRDSNLQFNLWGLKAFLWSSHFSPAFCADVERRLERADTTRSKHVSTLYAARLEKNLEWRTAIRLWGYEATLDFYRRESPTFRRALLEQRVPVLTGAQ